VDIATAVMTAAVASRSRSVVFIILINYASLMEDRGGAMRSVLKLVRTFFPDFGKSQQSFMFLFTHTDEIKSIPEDDLDAARQAVHDEILRTEVGTTNVQGEAVQQVLKFIRKSLLKKFPFYDVFHPLLSNASKIMANVERLSWTRGLQLAQAVACGGLTSASRFKLQGELHKLTQTLQHSLSRLDSEQHYRHDIFIGATTSQMTASATYTYGRSQGNFGNF
jgi:translation initiation factor 1 (eIF-1/SUI1)